MFTWVVVLGGKVKTVMLSDHRPAGTENWVKYPYPSDLGGAGNIAGTNISDYDENGNKRK